MPTLPGLTGTFSTILIDPPWRFDNRTGKLAPEHRRLNRRVARPNGLGRAATRIFSITPRSLAVHATHLIVPR